MSIAYSTYPARARQNGTDAKPAAPLARSITDVHASNVRPATSGVLSNRMDALTLQVGRLACYGLE
ncbi:hypothetical protein HNQ07_003359 [Deinococcus metalli]|uniref:Uncharacterized protein n=1 Tax=Deinococcus metalli TaxID=1141878 RepID=A0A7W8KGN1_9DEIO|nr:hypothetical protein [Deinococcus metalli]MBB5377859.1 hypothetical protein [Deinococcus metalli]GHF55435.1 hypothetical protein GCM10017781_34750 [Deinococcus metalli]